MDQLPDITEITKHGTEEVRLLGWFIMFIVVAWGGTIWTLWSANKKEREDREAEREKERQLREKEREARLANDRESLKTLLTLTHIIEAMSSNVKEVTPQMVQELRDMEKRLEKQIETLVNK